MPFGVVGQLDTRMRQAVGVGDCPMARGNFGVDMGHSMREKFKIFLHGQYISRIVIKCGF